MRYYFLFVSLLVLAMPVLAQSKVEHLNGIRKEVRKINTEAGLTKKLIENEDLYEPVPDGGASLTGFYRAGQLVKLAEWTGLSNGIRIREFYFKNGALLFVYDKFSIFPFDDRKQELDRTLTKVIYEGRFYFRNNKLYDVLTKGKDPMQTTDPAAAAQALPADARKLASLITNTKRQNAQ